MRRGADGRVSAASFRAAFDDAPAGHALVGIAPGEEGRLLAVNRALVRILGRTAEELLQIDPAELSHPEDLDVGLREMAAVIAGDVDTASITKRFRHADGSVIHALLSVSVPRGPAGEPEYAICHFQDVTEIIEAERTARDLAERYRLMMDATNDGVWVLDDGGSTTFVNARMAEMLGHAPTDMVGTELSHYTAKPDGGGRMLDDVHEISDQRHEEVDLTRRDGGRLCARITARPVSDDAGRRIATMMVVSDRTAERRAQAAIREREQRLRTAFDQALDAMVVADDDRRFVEANAAAGALFGLPVDALLGRRVEDFANATPDCVRQQWRELTDKGEQRGESEVVRADGEVHPVEFTARANFEPGRHLLVLRDISMRKRAEEAQAQARDEDARIDAALSQAQKLETVGQLAGGIAHDFNNLLAVILHSCEFALSELGDHPVAEEIAEVRGAAQRAATLTRQLLVMSRREIAQPETLDLNQLVATVGRLLRRTIGEHIELAASLDPDVPRVVADPTELEQVLLNVAINARDAMPDGGVLRLETRQVEVGEEFTRARADLVPGTYALVSVADIGTGMDPEVQRRALEPFFTTKAKGEGTGLGLATAYGIVRSAGGSLEILSEPEAGTTIQIYLPAAHGGDGGVNPAAGATQSAGPAGHGQRVLLVEDEDGVRRITERLLRENGYDVISVIGPEQALAVDPNEQIDAVLTDVVMPGMSGPDLVARLKERWPRAGVIYMSGYSDRVPARAPGVHFLSKPFETETLLEQVADATAGWS